MLIFISLAGLLFLVAMVDIAAHLIKESGKEPLMKPLYGPGSSSASLYVGGNNSGSTACDASAGGCGGGS
jgi:hypothetical protein